VAERGKIARAVPLLAGCYLDQLLPRITSPVVPVSVAPKPDSLALPGVGRLGDAASRAQTAVNAFKTEKPSPGFQGRWGLLFGGAAWHIEASLREIVGGKIELEVSQKEG